MKKILAICLILSVIAIFISGCEKKDKTTSSVVVGENNVTTSQTETSSGKTSKPIIDRTDKTSSEQISSEEKSSSEEYTQEEDVKYIYADSEKIKLASSDITFHSTITKIYEYEELVKIYNTYHHSSTCTIEKLNSLYPIEHIKERDYGYSVMYVCTKGALFLLFDESQKLLSVSFRNFSEHVKQDFSQISLGDTHEHVLNIAPDGRHFWHTSDEQSLWSFYYTSDGYYVDIEYIYIDNKPYTYIPEDEFDRVEVSKITIYAL